MLYFLAVFATPLAFLFMKKWVQFVFSMIFACFVIAGLIMGVVPGILLWIIHIVWAVMVINSQKQQKMHGEMLSALQESKEAPATSE